MKQAVRESLKRAALIAVGVALGVSASSWINDPMLQRNFPCQEDEVLMFVDTPSKADLGCVAWDEILDHIAVEAIIIEVAPTTAPTTLGGN